jgi:hypothetical protein
MIVRRRKSGCNDYPPDKGRRAAGSRPIGPKDPERAAILRKLRRLLARLPDGETAVFQEEVDINSNPKIGAMWMRRGQQAEVPTPGTNEKRYLARSPDWRTGALRLTESAPGAGGTPSCSCATWRTSGAGWGATGRSTSSATTPGRTTAVPCGSTWGGAGTGSRCTTCRRTTRTPTREWLENGIPFSVEGSVYPKPPAA